MVVDGGGADVVVVLVDVLVDVVAGSRANGRDLLPLLQAPATKPRARTNARGRVRGP
jgi:hypothetical protein